MPSCSCAAPALGFGNFFITLSSLPPPPLQIRPIDIQQLHSNSHSQRISAVHWCEQFGISRQQPLQTEAIKYHLFDIVIFLGAEQIDKIHVK